MVSSFKYFLPEINFHALYSSLKISDFNLLSLKILSPVKEIFLIFALDPSSILYRISIKLFSLVSVKTLK